jgi:hypothetical protein
LNKPISLTKTHRKSERKVFVLTIQLQITRIQYALEKIYCNVIFLSALIKFEVDIKDL